ncbi:MAG: hypothetical protein COY38_05550 [Candidatus Aenigmarchaeota archaeon CG_4_10_14_0_8_um_filter_37_24]|nr:hypothetical protein [Candidatus Aenigmarchaeota archaeon]OIN85416.1 MAG: hypothetical protein AUJ50_05005 [Candidatus Aenigmarchaeota archaeon CG1_02_38_14]PIV68123.1 MAG: hypothetical protein COS07_05190 [Candidatus Aenigmarchaeota archaeon CG01_land_8_20_14_3_00_37_9]PIX50327.1 MAG: hypothetical protein COZ52_04875 [Candidatus Aenigmarchaeota archaeon CG_4_8_14_3_um_filter_37_24]PIY35469.1 MAG: hypothetical protein COZ04_03430 [Candidatus Aenigmarchaeota archaeon CG_4_10_14_3_um_filter_37
MSKINISDIIKKGESEFLELKSSLSDSNRIVEEICGLANASKNSAFRDIDNLLEEKIINRGGYGKNIYYILV